MVKLGLNQNDVKIRNRSRVLKILRRDNGVSRKDIADEMNLTKAAISSIISELIEEKIIVETGSKETGAIGRSKITLELNRNYKYVLGLSITETYMILMISNILGETIDSFVYEISKSEKNKNEEIANFIIDKSINLLWNNNIDKKDIIGFGIGYIGGLNVMDIEYIKDEITKKMQINVVLENNVKALAMSQMDFGSNTEIKNFLFVKYGPGLGMAVVQNGALINGNGNRAGEIGHTIADPNANTECRCGRKGCLESLISEKGIVKDLDLLGEGYTGLIINRKMSIIDYGKINQLIKEGDLRLSNIFETRYEYLAKALANSIILLDPEYVYVYGAIFNQPLMFEMIRERVNKYLGYNTEIIFKLSDLDPDNSAIGSVAIALRNFFYNIGGNIPK